MGSPSRNPLSGGTPARRPLVWLAQGWWIEDVFEGVLEAAEEYGWELDHSMRYTRSGIVPAPGRADGVIVFTGPDRDLIPLVRKLDTRVVDMEPFEEHYPGAPKVIVSNRSVGERAALHLASGDPGRLIFLGPERDNPASEARLSGFLEGAEKIGLPSEVIRITDFDPVATAKRGRAGVFGVVDSIALAALRRCTEAGIRVPEELAVLGANDDPGARLVKPALSSVPLGRRLLGRVAADTLKRLMDGDPHIPRETAIPVPDVRVRESTITVRTGDAELDTLVRHLCVNAHRPELLFTFCEECGIAPRTASRLVERGFGLTPGELLDICRLRLAQRFSTKGELTAAGVADASGFGGRAAMARAKSAGLPSWETVFPPA